MKILSWILLLCFFSNAMAATTPALKLERIVNDYQYDLTVDWDQKDQAAAQKMTLAFLVELEKLMRDEGVTKEDINQLLEKKVTDKKELERLKTIFTIFTQKGSTDKEVAEYLISNVSDIGMRGASWNGRNAGMFVAAGLLIVIGTLIAKTIIFHATHYCAEKKTWECCETHEIQDCETTYYYDYETGQESSSYSCWGTGQYETTCSTCDSCTRYEKKP